MALLNRKVALTVGCGVALICMMTSWQFAQQPPALNSVPQQDAQVLMQVKLTSSQRILEGLMAGDFELIEKGGKGLAQVCDSMNWRRRDDQVVSHYRGELHRSALKITRLANEQNLEGAAYAYMHTMTTCINCHDYARNVLRITSNTPQHAVTPIPVTAAAPQPGTPVFVR